MVGLSCYGLAIAYILLLTRQTQHCGSCCLVYVFSVLLGYCVSRINSADSCVRFISDCLWCCIADLEKLKESEILRRWQAPFGPVELASSGKTKQRRCFAHLESVTIACIAAVISPVL